MTIELKNIEKFYKNITNTVNKFSENQEISKYFTITVDDSDFLTDSVLYIRSKGNDIIVDIIYNESDKAFYLQIPDCDDEGPYTIDKICKKLQELAIGATILTDIKKQLKKAGHIQVIHGMINSQFDYDVCCGMEIDGTDQTISINYYKDKIIIYDSTEDGLDLVNLSNPNAFKQVKEIVEKYSTPLDAELSEKIRELAFTKMFKEDIKAIQAIHNKYFKE